MSEILAPMDYQIGPVLYSAALHGSLDRKEFRRRCDGKGATLLVIETDNGCVCVCSWMCMDVCMDVCMWVCMCMDVYVCVCVCVNVCVDVCVSE